MAAEYEVDELMVITITHNVAARVRSYELLAEAFHQFTICDSGYPEE